MRLQQLFEDFAHRCATSFSNTMEITHVTAKPERADRESLFVCVRSSVRDGHFSALAAYHHGCRAFVAERGLGLPDDAAVLLVKDSEAVGAALAAKLLDYPVKQLSLFGVAGALGKTTVAVALADLLDSADLHTAAILTEGVYLNGTLTRFENTVPNAVELQYLLASLVGQGVTHAVLEISAYMLTRNAWKALPFSALTVTEAGDSLPLSVDLLIQSKAEVLLMPTRFSHLVGDVRVLSYGKDSTCFADAVKPCHIKGGFGTRFMLCMDGSNSPVSLSIPGDFALKNALLVARCAQVAGVPFEQIAALLSRVAWWGCLSLAAAVRGRRVYLDAAYTPDALAAALFTLRQETRGKLSVLLGSVGGRSHVRRTALSKVAERYADFIYLTADNPDNEDAQSICEEMALGIEMPWRYVILPDRAEAIRRAVLELRPDDTLLIAGKAREGFQLIGGKKIPFDEKSLVKHAAKLL